MITTVTQKNMITIPAEVSRRLGIKPGWKLDWQLVEGKDEILVRVIAIGGNWRGGCWAPAGNFPRNATAWPS